MPSFSSSAMENQLWLPIPILPSCSRKWFATLCAGFSTWSKCEI